MPHDDLNALIDDIRHGIHIASQNYDVYWVLIGQETRRKYTATMNRYPQFFQAGIHAHFVATILALYRLYEKRKDTHNIPRLIKQLKKNELLSAGVLKNVEALMAEGKPIWTKVSMLRNEAFAHRSSARSITEAFKAAGITPNQLRDLIALSKKLINAVTKHLRRETHAFNLNAARDTIAVLDDLKKKVKS